MNNLTVTVYTTGPSCMACRQTKRHLDKRGIAYTEQPLTDENLDAALELGFTTAPVVFAATRSGEQSWDGYRPDHIDRLLKTSSEDVA